MQEVAEHELEFVDLTLDTSLEGVLTFSEAGEAPGFCMRWADPSLQPAEASIKAWATWTAMCV